MILGIDAIGRQLLLVLLTLFNDSSATVVLSCGMETTLRSLQVCGACSKAERFYEDKGNMWSPGSMSVGFYDAASDDRNRSSEISTYGGVKVVSGDVIVFVLICYTVVDRLCGLVVRVLGYRSGGPGSIPGTTGKKM
jgi:hypothetical protein